MIAALRYELVRIRTVRSTWIALVLAFVLPLGLAWLLAAPSTLYTDTGEIAGEGPGEWVGAFAFPLTLTAVIASVVASQAIGQEYRFGVIRLTLSAFPSRARILAAKIVVAVLASAVLALVSLLASWLAVAARGHPTVPAELPPPDSTFFLRGAVFVVLWALSGFALAGITRQTAVGIAVPIISGLIVETILRAVLFDRAEWLVRILPWSTANNWQAVGGGEEFPGPSVPQGWGALAVFAAWVLAFLVLQVVSFLRRDA